MEIVTGVGEKPHVTSKKFRRIIESITGQGSYIIGCGDNMSTELVSNNLLKIKSGAMIHHGNVSSVDPYDEIEINNGTQGMKRIDLVVNRYTKNAETEIEKNEWIVIQGAPAASNPAVPEHVVGNLQEGDLIDDCPFCQIYIDGINVTEVKELLTIIPNVPDLVAENAARKQEVAELNSKIDDITLNNKTVGFFHNGKDTSTNINYEINQSITRHLIVVNGVIASDISFNAIYPIYSDPTTNLTSITPKIVYESLANGVSGNLDVGVIKEGTGKYRVKFYNKNGYGMVLGVTIIAVDVKNVVVSQW